MASREVVQLSLLQTQIFPAAETKEDFRQKRVREGEESGQLTASLDLAEGPRLFPAPWLGRTF